MVWLTAGGNMHMCITAAMLCMACNKDRSEMPESKLWRMMAMYTATHALHIPSFTTVSSVFFLFGSVFGCDTNSSHVRFGEYM
jgi:hypothetical protein